MKLFKTKEKSKLDLFETRLENVKVWDKGKIKKNYDTRLPVLLSALTNLVVQFPSIRFLALFQKEGHKRSWYSANLGRVVLNTAFNPQTPEFEEEFQKAVKDYQYFELDEKSLN